MSAEVVARSLLAKRKAFEHEREVRIIYFEGSDIKHPNGVYKYDLDPKAVFDQIMIDPRISYDQYKICRDEIVERTGFDKSLIKRSLIYKPPDGFEIEIP